MQNQHIAEKYSELFISLKGWRASTQGIASPKKGILPFVSGLRFSARLIYITRKIIKNSGLKADWGHIIDANNNHGSYYSNECDIIIYKAEPGSEADNWNGDEANDPVMNFKFISQSSVIAVVSCKSFITKSSIDKKYPTQILGYCKDVWLFAELCGSKSEKSIRKAALKHGYKEFWNLYTWSPKSDFKENIAAWEDYEGKVLTLARLYP